MKGEEFYQAMENLTPELRAKGRGRYRKGVGVKFAWLDPIVVPHARGSHTLSLSIF